MTNEVVIFILFILAGLLNIIVTYFNKIRFTKLCNAYKSKYGFLPPERTTFNYFDFSIAYTKTIPTGKIAHVYFPIVFKKNYSWNKWGKYDWYDFVNNYSLSFKVWVMIEILLTAGCFILLIAFALYHFFK